MGDGADADEADDLSEQGYVAALYEWSWPQCLGLSVPEHRDFCLPVSHDLGLPDALSPLMLHRYQYEEDEGGAGDDGEDKAMGSPGGSGGQGSSSHDPDGDDGGDSSSSSSTDGETEAADNPCAPGLAPKEGSLAYFKAARDAPVWSLGGQQCAATTQQAAFLLMLLKREGRIRNGPFERCASVAGHAA